MATEALELGADATRARFARYSASIWRPPSQRQVGPVGPARRVGLFVEPTPGPRWRNFPCCRDHRGARSRGHADGASPRAHGRTVRHHASSTRIARARSGWEDFTVAGRSASGGITTIHVRVNARADAWTCEWPGARFISRRLRHPIYENDRRRRCRFVWRPIGGWAEARLSGGGRGVRQAIGGNRKRLALITLRTLA